jgi:hypothetical protein
MMFDPSTVLILGAGASTAYGFPLGRELKQRIIQNASNANTSQAKQMLEAGYSEAQIRDLHMDLVRSIHPTIDAFLEDRPSRREIGAFAIAQALMPLENEETLYPHKDWYPMLFRELNLKDAESVAEVSAIVTFNYDRSLEHYLGETTRRTFEDRTRETALAKLSRIPILHVHGLMGSYPEMPYKPQRTTDDIKLGAKGISMIHDDHLDNAAEFDRARELVKTATDVVFLGFGYDRRSLRRLGILDACEPPTVFGTARALPSDWKGEIKAMFKGKIKLDENNYTITQFLPHLHEVKLQEREQKAKQVSAEGVRAAAAT